MSNIFNKNEKKLTLREFIEIDNAIRRDDLAFLKKYVKDAKEGDDIPRVNLSRDPLLNVMIAYGSKNESLLELIKSMPPEDLMAKNENGDTALHLAAAKDRLAVATALIEQKPELMMARNDKYETPLLKAAIFGSTATFRELKDKRLEGIDDRTFSGATVLHYAITGNNPELALEIAHDFKFLMFRRDLKALTPLQLIVTIPQMFRSRWLLAPAESFLYSFIPSNSHGVSKEREKNTDEEEPGKSIWHDYWVESNAESDKLFGASEAMSSTKFLKNYQLISYLFHVAKHVANSLSRLAGYCLDAFRVRFFIIFILKKLSKRVEELEILKKNHVQTMKLIAYLARDPEYWDFINKGMFQKEQTEMDPDNMIFRNEFHDYDDDDEIEDDDDDDEIDYHNAPMYDSNERTTSSLQKEKEKDCISSESPNERTRTTTSLPKENGLILEQKNLILEQKNLIREFTKQIKSGMSEPAKKQLTRTRWVESPLIVGAKMGLYDFVEQILKVYPESAKFTDLDGRNVLQVAIQNGQLKIVKIIAGMISGPNPVLPSWLLWDIESDKMNTILHYAAETTIKDEGFALQMQREIKWFEMVKKMVPKDLENSRNADELTAQELFIEKHGEMMMSARNQLMDIGKTFSGLLAAVVFATSFNIPGGKDSADSNNNSTTSQGKHISGSNDESVGFKVFSHTYVIGLSFATCSLVLFLSLLSSNYRPEAFRKSLPTKYILATASFFFAMMSFLVAFTCNVYLSIHGGGVPKAKDLLPMILELIGFPFLCALVLFFGGFGLRFSDFFLKNLHR